jgi:hypothetical protein
MIMGDHRQEKKRNRKTNSSGWIRTSTRVTALTILTGQLDWDINMAEHCTQTTTEKTSKTAAPPRNRTHASNETLERSPPPKKEAEGQTPPTEGPPPCGAKCRRSAAPKLTARQREEHRVRRNTRVRGDHQPATRHASPSCAGTSQPAARLHTSESSQELPSRKSEGAPPLRDRNKPQTTTKE